MRLLGLDLGSRTIGVAVCDAGETVATPLRTLERRGGEADLAGIASLVETEQVEGVVLGLPLTTDGQEGAAAARVRRFGDALATKLHCPVSYQDERFTTVEAERVLLEADLSRRRRKQVVDKVAATLILQTYLDRSRQATSEGDEDGQTAAVAQRDRGADEEADRNK